MGFKKMKPEWSIEYTDTRTSYFHKASGHIFGSITKNIDNDSYKAFIGTVNKNCIGEFPNSNLAKIAVEDFLKANKEHSKNKR